jgi:hypothetical protein
MVIRLGKISLSNSKHPSTSLNRIITGNEAHIDMINNGKSLDSQPLEG